MPKKVFFWKNTIRKMTANTKYSDKNYNRPLYLDKIIKLTGYLDKKHNKYYIISEKITQGGIKCLMDTINYRKRSRN